MRLFACFALCLSLFLAPRAAAQSPQSGRELDRAAIEAYRRQDFALARELWQRCLADPEMVRSRAEKGRVLYDLGNAAYRDKQVLEAVGWYTAALRERPRDGDTWKNLEQARSDAHLEPQDRGDLYSSMERLFTSLTLEESRALAFCAALGWALVLAGEAFFGGRSWAWLARLATLGMLVCLVPWALQSARAGANELLVVSAQPLELRSEPREDAARVLELKPGERVRFLDELPDWIKVEDSGERTGWAKRETLFSLRR